MYFNIQQQLEGKKLFILQKIGQGGWGQAFKGYYEEELVVVKVIQKIMFDGSENPRYDKDIQINEIIKQKQKENKNEHSHNTVKIIDILKKENIAFIIQEYCEEDNLYAYRQKQENTLLLNFNQNQFYCLSLLQNPKIQQMSYNSSENLFSEELYKIIRQHKTQDYIYMLSPFDDLTIASHMLQIAKGLQFLHSNNIIHRDLKPDNIFVMRRQKGEIIMKISDFDISIQGQNFKKFAGLQLYSAPEVIQGKESTNKSDIWSFGCILFYVVTNLYVFREEKIFWKFKKRSYDFFGKGSTINKIIEEDVFEKLIKNCLNQNPDKRPDVQEIITALEEIIKKFENTQTVNGGRRMKIIQENQEIVERIGKEFGETAKNINEHGLEMSQKKIDEYHVVSEFKNIQIHKLQRELEKQNSLLQEQENAMQERKNIVQELQIICQIDEKEMQKQAKKLLFYADEIKQNKQPKENLVKLATVLCFLVKKNNFENIEKYISQYEDFPQQLACILKTVLINTLIVGGDNYEQRLIQFCSVILKAEAFQQVLNQISEKIVIVGPGNEKSFHFGRQLSNFEKYIIIHDQDKQPSPLFHQIFKVFFVLCLCALIYFVFIFMSK